MNGRLSLLAVVALLAVLAGACTTGGTPAHGSLTIDLLDPRGEASQRIGEHLVLSLSGDSQTGWDVGVYDERAPDSGNLLYHSRKWHGPYPTQIWAWNVAGQHFSNDRWLCVHRVRPRYEVRALVRDVETIGSGTHATFKSGTLVVEWWRRRCRGPGRRPGPSPLATGQADD